MFGVMKPAFALAAMPFAIGLTKNGIFVLSILSKISFSNSGGMAEPSA